MRSISGIIILCIICASEGQDRKTYSTYVWTTGFDHVVPGCDEEKFLAWSKKDNPECFTHTWNTAEKRDWLWKACNVNGREISSIFLSDVHHNLKYAKDNNDCTTDDIVMVRQTLKEGHTQVRCEVISKNLSQNIKSYISLY